MNSSHVYCMEVKIPPAPTAKIMRYCNAIKRQNPKNPIEIPIFASGNRPFRKLKRRKISSFKGNRLSPLATPAIQHWFMDLRQAGYAITRLRVMAFPPGRRLRFHRDESRVRDDCYRVFIPLQRSPRTTLEWKEEGEGGGILKYPLSKKGQVLLINVSSRHRLVNQDQDWVFFLVASVWSWPTQSKKTRSK
jgi:hypothetical protein